MSIILKMETLLKIWPDAPWDYNILSYNPNITLKYVLDNPDKPWSYHFLAQNSSITMKDILAHPELPWDYSALSLNQSITMKDVWDNPQIPWHYASLSTNINLSMKDIFYDISLTTRTWAGMNWWSFHYLSQNNSLTIDDVIEHIEFDWDCYSLSQNFKVKYNDLKILLKEGKMNKIKGISNDYLKNKIIKKEIKEKKEMNFQYDTAFITVKDVVKLKNDLNGNRWCEISVNPNISIKDILEHPELTWVYSFMCFRSDITLSLIEKYHKVKLPLITPNRMGILAATVDPNINFQNLSYNRCNGIIKEIKEIKAVIPCIDLCSDITAIIIKFVLG